MEKEFIGNNTGKTQHNNIKKIKKTPNRYKWEGKQRNIQKLIRNRVNV